MSFDFSPTFGNMYTIGSFDAKTYFAELLRKVQEGAVFNISKNGKQVAVLQGVKTAENQEALEAHRRIVERSKRFAPTSSAQIKELKNAGKKY